MSALFECTAYTKWHKRVLYNLNFKTGFMHEEKRETPWSYPQGWKGKWSSMEGKVNEGKKEGWKKRAIELVQRDAVSRSAIVSRHKSSVIRAVSITDTEISFRGKYSCASIANRNLYALLFQFRFHSTDMLAATSVLQQQISEIRTQRPKWQSYEQWVDAFTSSLLGSWMDERTCSS